jgi:predicted TPR repeat methyltransferase
LVQELGYNGFERLRRGFDRAFGGQKKVPSFSLVIDAGCGTGLVGEQVRCLASILLKSKQLLQNASDLLLLCDHLVSQHKSPPDWRGS